MKNIILFSLIFISVQAIGQKKAQIEEQAATIDTLTMLNTSLTAQVDTLTSLNDSLTSSLESATKSLELYYSTLKEKVMIEDFDPAALPDIIDSLKATRDDKITSLSTTTKSQTDSIAFLSTMVSSLQDSLASIENAEADKDEIVAELKQLKELLDSGILTQEEYEAKKAKLMEKW